MKNLKIKQEFALILIMLFILGSITPVMVNASNETSIKKIDFQINFSKPEIIENSDFVEIILPESNSFLTDEKNPKLPIYSKTLEFNPNTKIIKINVIPNDLKEFKINKQVQPVPIKQEMNEISLSSNVEVNEDVYLKNTPYPELWYNYKLGAGLNKKNNHVTFLNINLCPVRYNPGENIIQYVGNFEVQIKYVEPQYNPVFTDDFNLVIISPSEFIRFITVLNHSSIYLAG